MRFRCRVGIHRWVQGETKYIPDGLIALFYIYHRTCNCCHKSQTLVLPARLPFRISIPAIWKND